MGDNTSEHRIKCFRALAFRGAHAGAVRPAIRAVSGSSVEVTGPKGRQWVGYDTVRGWMSSRPDTYPGRAGATVIAGRTTERAARIRATGQRVKLSTVNGPGQVR